MTTGDFRDITRSMLPIGAALALAFVVFQVGGIYTGLTSGSNATQSQIGELKDSIAQLAESVEAINRRLNEVPSDVIRKVDLLRFCLFLERNNKGFNCPNDI